MRLYNVQNQHGSLIFHVLVSRWCYPRFAFPDSVFLKNENLDADGGVIGCQNTGISFNLFNIVVTTSDQSAAQGWGGSGTTTADNSTTDGAANTTKIVAALRSTGTTFAARTCNELSVTGGFTSGWFLPSGSVANSQLNCLYNNRAAIATGSVAAVGAGFASANYWSSTEASSTNAWRLLFTLGNLSSSKSSSYRVRCSRAF